MLKIILFLLTVFSVNLYSQVAQQWARQYNGTGNGDDAGFSIAVDVAGNIYIAGSATNPSLNKDYAVIKYNSLGVQQWVTYYNGPGDGDDIPKKIVVDQSGFIYVTGQSMGSGSSFDYATIKYNSSGVQQWVSRYNGTANLNDYANFLAVDNSGNVFVTGQGRQLVTTEDCVTIKYNSSGDSLWVRKYNYNIENRDENGVCIVLDNAGNSYVVGYAKQGTNGYMALVMRYSSTGVQQWLDLFDGGLYSDFCSYVTLDAGGNVFVTGRMDVNGGGGAHNIFTRKYNSAGTLLWAWRSTFQGCGNVCAIDNSGNVITTGYKGWGPGYEQQDFITLKHNTNGDTLWTKIYNGPSNGHDVSNSLAIDAGDSIYICGYSPGSGTGVDFATFKYSPSGTQQWVQRYNFSGVVNDYGNAIGLDNTGNVYVAGYSGSDMTTIRYSQYLPSVPVLFSPANNATLQPLSLNLVWRKSTNVITYRVQLATDSLFNTLIVNDSTLTDSIRAVSGLNYNTNYWWRVNGKNASGTSLYSAVWKFRTMDPVGIEPISNEIPNVFKLYTNYPNPFNPITKIRFDIPKSSFTRLSIFDILGKEVVTFVNEQLNAGKYEVTFDASKLASGMYFYRIETESYSDVKKMVLLK